MAIKAGAIILAIVISSLLYGMTRAADPDPMQDYCIADLSQGGHSEKENLCSQRTDLFFSCNKGVRVNGYPCKCVEEADTDDFVYTRLRDQSNVSNAYGANGILGFVQQFPALNTQGMSVARLDWAPGGLIPLHTHPRATEIIYVVSGRIYAGFVTSDDRLFAKVIRPGDVMIFPRGLIHFQLNIGSKPAQAFVVLNSQNPGFQIIAHSTFGTNLTAEVLTKNFFLDADTVEELQNIDYPIFG